MSKNKFNQNNDSPIFGVSSADDETPIYPWVDPTTRALFITTLGSAGTISATGVNSTITPLGSNAAYTGTLEEITQYASITVAVFANQASATDGLQMQQSMNGTNWDIVDSYSIPASTGKTFGIQVTARYFRVVYTNGSSAQATFRIQTIYHATMPNGSSQRPQDTRTNDNDFQEVSAYASDFNGTSWDRRRNNTTQALIAAATSTSQSNIALTTYNARSLAIAINITIATTATALVTINGVTASGYAYPLLVGTSLVTTGLTVYRIAPSLTPSTNAVANDIVPRNVTVSVAVTGTIAYGVDAVLGV